MEQICFNSELGYSNDNEQSDNLISLKVAICWFSLTVFTNGTISLSNTDLKTAKELDKIYH